MDYNKAYRALCAKGAARMSAQKSIGMHDHHIVPRAEGGSDDRVNLTRLTVREHFVAHWLLWKMQPGSYPRAHAFFKMRNTNGIKLNSKTYAKLQQMHADNGRQHMKKLHADPVFAAQHAVRARQICVKRNSDSNHKAKVSQGLKRKYANDPVFALQKQIMVFAREADEAVVAKRKRKILESKKDPAYVQRQASGSAASNKRRFSKPVGTADGLRFESNAAAVVWLKQNGWPKASPAAISRVCLGKNVLAYGKAWFFVEMIREA